MTRQRLAANIYYKVMSEYVPEHRTLRHLQGVYFLFGSTEGTMQDIVGVDYRYGVTLPLYV